MTATDTRCLHSNSDAVITTAKGGESADVRVQLTAKLRCASQMGCSQAVSCSDDAMVVLRKMLGNAKQRG